MIVEIGMECIAIQMSRHGWSKNVLSFVVKRKTGKERKGTNERVYDTFDWKKYGAPKYLGESFNATNKSPFIITCMQYCLAVIVALSSFLRSLFFNVSGNCVVDILQLRQFHHSFDNYYLVPKEHEMHSCQKQHHSQQSQSQLKGTSLVERDLSIQFVHQKSICLHLFHSEWLL